MKSLRKSILTLLALTLFGGAGAWAQGPTVTELTTSIVPEDWYNQDNVNVTKAELEAWGFVETDSATAAAWTGADPTVGTSTNLYYGFTTDGKVKYIHFENGTLHPFQREPEFITHYDLQSTVAYIDNTRIFITTGGGAIELTKSGANQWSLGQAPDYDLELQVEYYEAHALKNIPAGWQVMVNGVPQTQPYQGDSLMITETDSVTLVPAGNPRRVKSVTLEDEGPAVQTITVSGHKIYYLPGETWEQAIMNHPENTGWYIQGSWVFFDGLGGLLYNEFPYNEVGKGDNIDPNRPYYMGI